MARKGQGKFETHVRPRIEDIVMWARNNVTEEEMAKNLHVSQNTFRKYKREHEILRKALSIGRSTADAMVENALHKKATGYYVKSEKPIKVKEVYFDEKGRKCEKEKIEVTLVDEYIEPDVGAQKYYLNNRLPELWKNKIENTLDGNLGIEIGIDFGEHFEDNNE